MSKKHWKQLPVDQARRYLEPGPVVLLSTAHRDERAIMTLGWHMMLGYDLVGTYLWQANRSHALAHASR
jgi:flavin reductase (DIM6/NTAB) family NADH-FMN oxidoreductase RutF